MRSRFKTEFDKLWLQTAGKVRAYMFCACGSWTDADDMLQDCFLRALRGWEQFDGRGSRRSWLFGIARRTRADWFRKKRRNNVKVSPANLDDFDGGLFEKSNADKNEAVWGAIKELNAEQIEVIQLRFAAALSYVEIAQALEIPVGTVRSRLHRGLKTIREKVRGQKDET